MGNQGGICNAKYCSFVTEIQALYYKLVRQVAS